MPTEDEVRAKMNEYIYWLNSSNVFGVLSWYAGAVMTGVVSAPVERSRVGFHAMGVAVLVVLCFAVRFMMRMTFNFRDVCECASEKSYHHPKVNTCPLEPSLQSVYRDMRYVVEEQLMNGLYRFNVVVPFLFAVLAGFSGSATLNAGALTLYVAASLVVLLLVAKLAVNLFFLAQDFCPCDCKAKRAPTPPTPPIPPTCDRKMAPQDIAVEVGKEVSDAMHGISDPSDMLRTANDAIDASLGNLREFEAGRDPDMEKKIEAEIAQLMPKAGYEGRLGEMCKVATEVLNRYDTVDLCLKEVKNNEGAQAMVKSMLMDDPTYACLSSSGNDTQFDACFRDFFTRNPNYLLRLSTLMPKKASEPGTQPVTGRLDALCSAAARLKAVESEAACMAELDAVPEMKALLSIALDKDTVQQCVASAESQSALGGCFTF